MTNQKRNERYHAIVAAACDLILEIGVHQASIKGLANKAGVAPGLIHYYFATKDDLLAAVVKELSHRYRQRLEALGTSLPADASAAATFEYVKEDIENDLSDYRLRYDLYELGLRNPKIKDEVARLLQESSSQFSSHVQQLTATPLSDSQTAALATILLMAFDGLALRKATDVDFDLDEAFQLLQNMVTNL